VASMLQSIARQMESLYEDVQWARQGGTIELEEISAG
jgi:hypothetical protein